MATKEVLDKMSIYIPPGKMEHKAVSRQEAGSISKLPGRQGDSVVLGQRGRVG